ncbi:hypothetical protein C8J57DRAFT_1638735 [Mycena rebaudengoi]|nr:hypothetical protein C8J57DRAFT_1638735 [Mycena rebaudengoi]
MSSSSSSECPLPDIRRIVTGHTSAGKSTIISDTIQPPTLWSPESVNAKYDLHYTGESPAVIDTEVSQGKWVDEIAQHPELISENGSTFRAFNFSPGSVSPVHRTVSLDYGVVAKGSVVLELEDGARITLREGDTIIQRATMHCWRNESTEWARIYFIGLGAKPVHVNGQALQEEWRKDN